MCVCNAEISAESGLEEGLSKSLLLEGHTQAGCRWMNVRGSSFFQAPALPCRVVCTQK